MVAAHVSGAMHAHMAAQLLATWLACKDAIDAYRAANPDVPYLDPLKPDVDILERMIAGRLELLTPEEATAKRTGRPPS